MKHRDLRSELDDIYTYALDKLEKTEANLCEILGIETDEDGLPEDMHEIFSLPQWTNIDDVYYINYAIISIGENQFKAWDIRDDEFYEGRIEDLSTETLAEIHDLIFTEQEIEML